MNRVNKIVAICENPYAKIENILWNKGRFKVLVWIRIYQPIQLRVALLELRVLVYLNRPQ